ncbi:VTT domain-containing protein [Paenibacillus sp. FSL H8-0317]|uniref:DedA family protein n=1 Tax=Paenibacillus sp. FSL H8-0317 TaxID=2921385 RepID=UPI0032511A26
MINHKSQHHKHYVKAEIILNKSGNWAMCIGLFIPIVRYVLPLVMGLSGVQYRKFALISYSSALLWTITYFTAGIYFGGPILSTLHLLHF